MDRSVHNLVLFISGTHRSVFFLSNYPLVVCRFCLNFTFWDLSRLREFPLPRLVRRSQSAEKLIRLF